MNACPGIQINVSNFCIGPREEDRKRRMHFVSVMIVTGSYIRMSAELRSMEWFNDSLTHRHSQINMKYSSEPDQFAKAQFSSTKLT